MGAVQLPQKVVGSPSTEVLKQRLDVPLLDMLEWGF